MKKRVTDARHYEPLRKIALDLASQEVRANRASPLASRVELPPAQLRSIVRAGAALMRGEDIPAIAKAAGWTVDNAIAFLSLISQP